MSESKESYANETVLENTPDEYLAVVFKYADWIDISYKKLAAQYKKNFKAIRELYMCAYDKVPIEILTIAQNKEPVEESFRLIRKRYMESLIQNEYVQMLEEMSAMHREVKSISGTINDMVDTIPYLEELFADNRQSSNIGKETKEILNERSATNQENYEIDIEESKNINKKRENKSNKFQESFMKIKEKVSENLFRSKVSPVVYIQGMTENGFSTEQITFILECIDMGMNKRELDNIAISPKLPIEMMEKLKNMQLEKRKGYQKNGK